MARQSSKAMKRLYHLRKLREFRINTLLLKVFYESVIENVLFFSVVVWGGNATNQDKCMINRVRKRASRIINSPTSTLFEIYKPRATALANKIMSDTSHPLAPAFQKLPSGRRLKQPMARTKRFMNSFVPNITAILRSDS